ncbi:MAG: hypothetical protein JWO38_5753 [Gemmataceae bacterium]|nr:hypothetical protein [Gemmataceae bacterium]
MGHIRLGPLPRTRKWAQVVALIRGGAGAAQVATATAAAAEKAMLKAVHDPGVIETVWLLMQLPFAARSDEFTPALQDCGVFVSDAPGLLEIVGAVTDAIDQTMPNCRNRTDLGEMAQMAAAETLIEVIGGRVRGLFDATSADVQREFARLGTSKQFGLFAKDFFARFTHKTLDYYLSKTVPEQVGAGERFRTLGQQAEFTKALDLHCRETAKILETYSGDWLLKNRFEMGGATTRANATAFTAYAMTKLTAELRQRATPNGP